MPPPAYFPNYYTLTQYDGGRQAEITFHKAYSYLMKVIVTNACGETAGYKYVYVGDPNRPGYVSAYPNPASDILNVEIDADAIAQSQALDPITNARQLKIDPTFDLRLYDPQGNLLRQQKTKGGSVQFNVASLPNGIYYLHIYDGVNEKPAMRQIVVGH